MSLESATYATQLDTSNPLASDPRSQGDDHLRLIKSVMQTELAANNRQWVYTGDAVTRRSTTAFTVAGSDKTDVYAVGRRMKITGETTGTIYGTVTSSTFSATTAVNLLFDSGTLANETLAPFVSELVAQNSALPGAQTLLNFGGVGDGTTDNYTALTNAFAASAGRTLVIPEGTFATDIDETTLFTPGANTTIRGEGWGSVLRFNMQDTTTRTLFAISNAGVRFENLRIEINTSVTGGTIVGFQWSGNDLSFENVEIDGGVTADSATSHIFQVVKCDNTGTFNDLRVHGCYWHDVTRFWLRDTAATSDVKRLRFENSRFEACESSGFALNAPNGSVADVVFSGNNFTDAFVNAVQSDGYFIGPHGTNVTIAGNTFRGTGQECIHVEEAAKNIVISGNAISMNCAGRAIYVSDNNAGGSSVTPLRVSITGNVIKRTDEDAATGVGIELVNDASGSPPVTGVTISGNNIMGWGTGILNGNDPADLNVFSNNIIDTCGTGFSSKFGAPEFKDNLIANCTTGIGTITGGGMFGFNRFYGNTTNVNGTSGEVMLAGGFITHFDVTNLADSANTDFSTGMPVGANDRIKGNFSINAHHNDAIERHAVYDISSNGSTIAEAILISGGSGALTVTATAASSELVVRLRNTSGGVLSAVSAYCYFDGTYIIS